ncbi:MAG: HDIG domain-containing protein [Spirochaetales bacterium]|uniref:HDIG domain-containing protein n=1 Tax=Candidatus Thalassospirochaeta sargassi TaxID=3119039 RepID=A0AAJ1IFG9_9SPIO|nr:HDIG domain-containing protein [Spirochaetales bacterium]
MKEATKNKSRRFKPVQIKEFFLNYKLLSLIIAAVFIIFYVSAVFISGSGLFTAGVRLSDYEAGKVAERDIVVERDIEYEDTKATELKREAEELLVEPVFRVTESISERVNEAFNQFINLYISLLNEDKSPSEMYLELQSAHPGYFTEEQIIRFQDADEQVELLFESKELIDRIMTNGIVGFPDNLRINVDSIEILKWSNGEKVSELVAISDIYTIENLDNKLNALINPGFSESQKFFISSIIKNYAEENAFYDSEQTEANKKRAREQVEPVIKKIVKDEVIVKKGFIITEEDMIKIEALGLYSDNHNFTSLFGKLFLLVIILIVSLNLLRPPVLLESPALSRMYLMLTLFAIFILAAALESRYMNLAEGMPLAVFLPSALITMLVSIMINTRTGIMSAVIISLSLFLIPGDQVNNFIFSFISGVSGSLIVYKAEHRITLIRAGVVISLVNAGVVITLGLIQNSTLSYYLDALIISVINGFLCGVFTLGLLPILEHILNAPTPFRLMELSDLNTPLFKRMLILAPGTYSHSVSVANLAETAAKEIGANALLARVGAYYHDIGKIDQAEYFIENQKSGNKHDDLKATLSTAVIKSHVKIGLEKAKELGLPDEVIQIITQHHGSGKISYFYMKAMKEQKIDQKLSPDDFSYTGTPPVSREAAVVMLADTVEAATRTLKNPTMSKLERFVWDLIMEKVSSGQMRNSGLTFNDLELIKQSFVQILGGSFHTRIEYPDQNGKSAKDE